MTKKKLVSVVFHRHWAPYCAGDQAGFEPHVARSLCEGKRPVARYKADIDAEKDAAKADAKAPEPIEAAEDIEEHGHVVATTDRGALEKHNVDELKTMLAELGLPVSGNKSELIARLLEAFDSDEEE